MNAETHSDAEEATPRKEPSAESDHGSPRKSELPKTLELDLNATSSNHNHNNTMRLFEKNTLMMFLVFCY